MLGAVDHRRRAFVIYAVSILFASALVHHYYRLGGPYFEIPPTVQDHVWPTPFPSRDVILLSRRAADILPRGSTVTAVHPPQAPDHDVTLSLTAGGMMPHHRVVPATFMADPALRPRYVLAVRQELADPAYVLHTKIPDGWIYEVRP